MYKFFKNVLILATMVILTACGGTEPEIQVEKSAKELYKEATDLKNSGASSKVIFSAYEEVERQHPQSDLAKKSNVDLIEYSYDNLKYNKAIQISKNFLANNPSHKSTPKIHYILALSYYEKIVDSGRDQSNTSKAMETLNDVILAYPNTDFAISAKYKIDLTKDHLAAKELSVGRFYQKSGDYQAALNRFNNVIKQYSSTSQAPEALARLVETYLSLGLYNQAYKTASILGYNHSGNEWYAYSYDLLNNYKK